MKYKDELLSYALNSSTHEKYETMANEINQVYQKARAFDNYMVDLAKTMEEYPHNYIKSDNFAKETYEFYMKSKENFIKAYENEVGRKHELIRDAAEYDELINKMEGNNEIHCTQDKAQGE